jgi:membrane fusion protein, adhesin transport system
MKTTKDHQIRYLSQAVQLEEAVNPAIVRSTMLTIGVSILAFLGWAGMTNINEVARAPGEVVPSGYQQVVQHLEGGIVAQIAVKEGDIVKQGQELLVLDGAGTGEDLERARARKNTLLIQEERLRAYKEGRAPDFSRFGMEEGAPIDDQKSFFQSMEQADAEERKVIAQQISQRAALISSLQSEWETARGNHTLAAELFARKEELHRKGYFSETRYLEAKQSLNALAGEMQQIKSRIAATKAEMEEYKNRLSSLEFSQKDQVNTRLDAVLSEYKEHEELLRKLEEKYKRLIVRAPVDGIVKGLTVNTIGAIARPGDTLMEIVPIDHKLMVEVKIEPQHIGHLKAGQPVKIKLSSFDFSRYGLLAGELDKISATTFSGENGARYYKGLVRLSKNYVGGDERNALMPGMTAMAEIITGEKTILQYLLKPIHNSLKTAFSER